MKDNNAFENYILRHIGEEDKLLEDLNRETNLKVIGARMISGHLQGKVLTMLSKMINPSRILEIGTFTGYSAICLAKGLAPDGELITIEINDELEEMAANYFEKAGLKGKIKQLSGPALQLIPRLSGYFDLVFIDADKREYAAYYNLIFNKLNSGGYIIADNTLWNGKVLEELAKKDEQTRGIRTFNDVIANDNRIEKVILPLRDGMTIIRKK
ncbi:MAG: methyltransferase [Draconibacterium sp.]|nr:MAG: methyltransferase [Draconibacterium sp.]